MFTPANTAFSAAPLLPTLTAAERLVAVHVTQGLSNKEIAALLGKSEPTVKHQVSSILNKTGAYSRCRFIAHYYKQFFCLLPRTPTCTRRMDRDSAVKNPPPDNPACANSRLSGGGTSSRPNVRLIA